MNVRAKFRCVERTETTYGGSIRYKFSAVYDDGTPENRRYAKYTPMGELTITVDNPDVSFVLGESYYLDFAPEAVAPVEPAPAAS